TEAPVPQPDGGRCLAGDGHRGYWREWRGRNLIQARIAMAATSSHGDNRTCTMRVRTIRATMAMTARTMIMGMVIGLPLQWLCSCSKAAAGDGSRRSGSARIAPWYASPG